MLYKLSPKIFSAGNGSMDGSMETKRLVLILNLFGQECGWFS
jgi:hypothetical protein